MKSVLRGDTLLPSSSDLVTGDFSWRSSAQTRLPLQTTFGRMDQPTCGYPLDLLRSELIFTYTARWPGRSTSWERDSCAYSWHSQNMQVIGFDSVSRSARRLDTWSLQWYQMSLQSHYVPRGSVRLFMSSICVDVAQRWHKTKSTNGSKIWIFVLLRYRQRYVLRLS